MREIFRFLAQCGSQEFARRASVGLRFVRELEQGKTTVRLDKLNQVLEFLGHHLEVVRNGKGQ